VGRERGRKTLASKEIREKISKDGNKRRTSVPDNDQVAGKKRVISDGRTKNALKPGKTLETKKTREKKKILTRCKL